ncbi:MAG: FAD-dependent oxidoreductase [Caulobacteraceae bacterium]
MILDASKNTPGDRLDADLCIVGGGAAGLTLAHALRNTGASILVLESGAEAFDKSANELNAGEVAAGSAHPSPSLYRQRGLGGSTRIWGGRCVPFEPLDFEDRPGLRDGWPIPYEEVARFYPEANAYCDAGQADFNGDRALRTRESFIEGFADDKVLTRSLERFSLPTNFGARLKTDLAASSTVRVVTHATGLRLAFSPDGQVASVTAVTPSGATIAVHAKAFVVAVGGLEMVRLLGVSAPSAAPLHDNLGRYYMCHLEGTFGELAMKPARRRVAFGFERTKDGIYSRRRITLSEDVQRQDSLLNLAIRLHHPNVVDPRHGIGVLSAMYVTKQLILPEYRRKLSMVEHVVAAQMPSGPAFWMAHARNLVLDSPRTAAFAVDWTVRRYLMRRRIPYVALRSAAGVYPLDFNAEQLPYRESRVTLSPELDRLGLPKLRIDWRFTAQDIASVAASYRLMHAAFARSGVAELRLPGEDLEAALTASAIPVGGHHLGVARMSADPKYGVTAPDGRLHGSANLYVCGGATFPTSSHANPTLTTVALALRLAETLKTRLVA